MTFWLELILLPLLYCVVVLNVRKKKINAEYGIFIWIRSFKYWIDYRREWRRLTNNKRRRRWWWWCWRWQALYALIQHWLCSFIASHHTTHNGFRDWKIWLCLRCQIHKQCTIPEIGHIMFDLFEAFCYPSLIFSMQYHRV